MSKRLDYTQIAPAGICEEAARRADPQRHQRRHRERRARAGSASAILAGPGSPTWRCPGHGALGVCKAILAASTDTSRRAASPLRLSTWSICAFCKSTTAPTASIRTRATC
jgi:hypothetical protein